MYRFISITIAFISLAFAPLAVNAQDNAPDATIDIIGNNVDLGVEYTQARATLYFDGKSYPVQLQGLKADEIAGGRMVAVGEVYHLTRPEDLNGNYSALSADTALGDDAEGAAVQNQNGVIIKLHATTEGADVDLSVDGFAVKVAQ